MIAQIESFDPPPLAQERPIIPGRPETEDLGLKEGVSRIRDTTRPLANGKSEIVQQIHFDKDGFKTKEISFIDGFPDLITAWGWSGGKRTNFQSAVNYPWGEGPRSSRSAIVSGSMPTRNMSNPFARSADYGNTLESLFGSDGRPTIRKVFSNNGSLIYIEKFQYTANSRETKTSDSSGGFIGRYRELLDNEGNVVEKQVLGDDGSLFNSTRYEYSFDQKRNWIEKREIQTGTYGRRKAKKVVATYFRDILYYQPIDSNKVASRSGRPRPHLRLTY